MRIYYHYLAMAIFVPLYAIRVCPFIEKVDAIEVFVLIVVSLIVALTTRTLLNRSLVYPQALPVQSRRMFSIDLMVLIAAGILFGIYNTLVHGFPLSSGLKVLTGIVAMGLFASMDVALAHERLIANKVKEEGLELSISDNFTPFTRKLAFGAISFVVLIVGVIMLLVNKDLDWIIKVAGTQPLGEAKLSIMKEFAFVLGVAVIEMLNLILSFSRNINMFLRNENDVLTTVSKGRYHVRVPVSSNNEFGVMATHTNHMIRQIIERNMELSTTREVTILTLASLAEARDNETGAHILRTQRYVKALAVYLQKDSPYADELEDETIDLLYKSAPLHDIGKVGIPDAILLKPGKLTDDEFEIMKGHAQIGADALKVAEKHLGTNSFLDIARTISLTHHEKWDGSGYPRGLRGTDIPLAGRLMAIADVYDALITKRVYKPAFDHAKAMAIIIDGKGKHFDPVIIDALLAIESQFIQIASEFSDASYQHEMPLAG